MVLLLMLHLPSEDSLCITIPYLTGARLVDIYIISRRFGSIFFLPQTQQRKPLQSLLTCTMDTVPHFLLERGNNDVDTSNCTKSTCPAEWSTCRYNYRFGSAQILTPSDGYAPDLGSTIFFVAIFAVSFVTFLIQGFLRKGWTGFTVALVFGTAMESIGN